jgi:hypothetical protein
MKKAPFLAFPLMGKGQISQTKHILPPEGGARGGR